jgi:hypothetical protein
MFCPRCGQKLASNAVRFCANCGLRLEAVTYLLANDGHLPGPMTPEPAVPSLVPATLFVTGICWLLYARWFCDDKTPAPKKALPESLSQSVYSPFAQTHSASQLAPPIKTAEIEPPHSVIEHTTRQLIKE